MNDHQPIRLSLTILLLTLLGNFTDTSSAQRIGEQAEMVRLEKQADELSAQSDPEGAALAIGKAAMMADILITKAQDSSAKNLLRAASHLNRGQELGFRALALFEQTGGTPPAPAGICHYLLQSNKQLNKSKNLLGKRDSTFSKESQARQKSLILKHEEWGNLLRELHQEFECETPQQEN